MDIWPTYPRVRTQAGRAGVAGGCRPCRPTRVDQAAKVSINALATGAGVVGLNCDVSIELYLA